MGQKSDQGVWQVLDSRYSSISLSHVLDLKEEMHNIRKENDLVNVYMQKIKEVRGCSLSFS